ncbi:MAG: mevalonate kinase [Anaerolineales bacterium]|jgi:mevalonate kinase|nr:mevalonate kinase [Anaerolineales bacterium]
MPAISALAPGKVILFGEHAVVYGRPAIAVPVQQVAARVVVYAEPRLPGEAIRIQAPDIGLDAFLAELPALHPLKIVIEGVFNALQVAHPPALTLRITSTIPLAAGLGSGAAVSVAAVRALSAFLGQPLPDEQVSSIAYQAEKRHHGTPSGIDNTVITYNQPVYFVRGQPLQTFRVAAPFTLVIGDSGVKSPTSQAVGDLRQLWEADTFRYEQLFDAVGSITLAARRLIEEGRPYELGPLMNENHSLLQQMSISSPELDRLVDAAKTGGALGAKLSGGGRGGNMLALATPETAEQVAAALSAAGAVRVIKTQVG